MNKNTIKRISASAAALVIAAACTGCSDSKNKTESTSSVVKATPEAFEISAEDKDIGYSEDKAAKVVFKGSEAEISGKGASCSDGILTISKEGTYILSGSFDGQIYVKSKNSDIRLVLDGVSVTSSDGSALYVDKAAKVTLTTEEGTVNSFADSSVYSDTESKADAAVYCESDLTINGNGSLSITGNYKHAAASTDNLIITGGDINISSVSSGLLGKDSVKISDGVIEINAGSNGIKATKTEDSEKGIVSVSGGTLSINSVGDGIDAENAMRIDGGDVVITTGGGSENSSMKSDGSANESWGKWDRDDFGGFDGRQPPQMPEGEMPGGPDGQPPQMPDGSMDMGGMFEPAAYTKTSAETESGSEVETSSKGIKAGNSIEIAGGSLTIDSSDDSIHSNGSFEMSDGTIKASSGDDGIHADSEVLISGGTADITKSYEGIEGKSITVSGGDISVISSDDGFNAAGGSDTGMQGRPGMNDFAEQSDGEMAAITISGGTVRVNAEGDGIDSNGDLFVSGGTVYVNGPVNNGNGALDIGDSGCTAQITGGTVIAVGSSGMAVGFDESSTQYSVLQNLSGTASGGAEFTVADENGNVILSFTPEKNYQSVVFSCPELSDGSYTITAGELTEQISVSSVVTSNGSGGFGGGFGGGMRGGRENRGDFTF